MPSQASRPATIPSPQIVEQVEGEPTQFQPDSTVQVDEQPSPGEIPPSSQPSPVSFTPLPHTIGFTVQLAQPLQLGVAAEHPRSV